MADRFSKRAVVVGAKVLEIVVMAAGVFAFYSAAAWPAYFAVAMMAAQSALFGPSKYGIVPELVPTEELSRANGRLVAASYLAIVIGSAAAPWLTDLVRPDYARAGLVCVVIAVLGTATALPIRRLAPAAGRERKWTWFPGSIFRTLREVRRDREMSVVLWSSAYFSLIGAFMQLNLVPFGMRELGLGETASGFLFLYAAIGIGAGSLAAGRLSGRQIEFGIVPLGALLMTVACLALGVGHPGPRATAGLAGLAGLGAGFFIVPLDAFIQWRAPAERRGELLAANGFLSWVGVLLAGAMMLSLQGLLQLSPSASFAVLALLTAALSALAVIRLPDFLVRFIVMLLTRSLYRIRVRGLENVPAHGSALLVANHVSYVDAVLLLAIQPRRIRFLMHRDTYQRFRLRFLLKLMRVIPIASDDPPRRIVESLRAARAALDAGHLVCIFAEGALTRTGMMRGFRPGFERIVHGTGHAVVPVYIGGIWGSIFSHYHAGSVWRRPVRWPYPATLVFGKPLRPDTPPYRVRQAVAELSSAYFETLKSTGRPLGESFIRTARRHWFRFAMGDTFGARLTYGKTLIAALALADRIRPRARARAVGILLPPSVGGGLANLAVTLLGRIAVNLNLTASREAFVSAIRQSGLDTVITSALVMKKLGPGFPELPGVIRIEDMLRGLTAIGRARAVLKALFVPARRIARAGPAGAEETAALIFSSGTTGEPKGIALSHHNLQSNSASVALVLRPRREDVIASTLPLFHSFGYLAGLWLPLLHGMGTAFHVSPLEAQKVGELIRAFRCTALFTTPTFIQGYARRVPAGDFQTLRVVVTGAEKLRPAVAEEFRRHFGLRPVEGYGTTELSPVAALSLPDVEVDGVYFAGQKAGSVGQPVPGVAARVVDPDTGEPLGPGQPGMLMIKGPNVMTGYWQKPELTAEAVRDGWYRTGDIAEIDEDGFVFIRDRLARFSKIGGEMVPHGAVEDALFKVLDTPDPVVAVTSIPSERRGERLAVVYTPGAGPRERLQKIIADSALPNLWKPEPDAYVPVDHLPMTGTGKLDVRALRRIAESALTPPP
jgi:acyl-[acyl-carrier-protein]-phospholipid O-acyltransferase/long-chain-fatty-acid--[acyl-carrier-protein] ligase